MPITINGSGTVTGITAGGLPDAIITQPEMATNVGATGPAFSAYLTGTQSVTSGVYTKITINTEEFDTNNNFDSTTNYRFTPTVAGYYQVNAVVGPNGTSYASAIAAIYKNGSVYKYGPYIQTTNANAGVSCLVYMNGSTDYIELYAYQTASVASWGNGLSNYFQAALVRAA